MVKSKKPKKQVNLKPEFVLDKNAAAPNKPRKKHAPDRPQPEWMFPPDHENPVLNPKAKSEEKKLQEKQEHDHAIKFLKYKSVTTPMKAPPPALLLTLVGAFLSSYGLNSTSRIYTTELASRKKLDDWKVLLDEKVPKGYPNLVKLYKEGHKTYEEKTKMDETSSSDEEDDEERKAYKKSRKADRKKAEETSSSGGSDNSSDDSSSESDPDAEMEDAPPASKAKKAAMKAPRTKLSSSSSASTSSDSDADDEEEPAGAAVPRRTSSNAPTVSGLVNKLKRKAGPEAEVSPAKVQTTPRDKAEPLSSSSETSSSESEPGGEDETEPAKTTTAPLQKSDGDTTSSSSDSGDDEAAEPAKSTSTTLSDSDSSSSSSQFESKADFSSPTKITTITTTTTIEPKPRHGSSSSETLKATSDQKASTAETSLSSSSDSNSSDADVEMTEPKVTTTITQIAAVKRKRSTSPTTPASKKFQKKTNTPFERVPKDTAIDERFTNKYKSYDYADKAFQDLSVTKGKGFTKEKNKKKRGSYRGGAIDTGGGKGIKFED